MYVEFETLKKGVGSLEEFALARSINGRILEMCRKSGWTKVRHILLKIGSMRGIDPALMTVAFNVVSRGNLTEGANLCIMFLPTVLYCRACEREVVSEIDDPEHPVCPVCGSSNVEIHGGDEFVIEFLEVEKYLPWQLGGHEPFDRGGDYDDND